MLSGMRVNFFVHGKHLLSTHTLERGTGEKEEGELKQDCPPSMSANKFRKSQIRKFADLNKLRTFRKCENAFAICGPNLLFDLRIVNFRRSANPFILFILPNLEYNALIKFAHIKVRLKRFLGLF